MWGKVQRIGRVCHHLPTPGLQQVLHITIVIGCFTALRKMTPYSSSYCCFSHGAEHTSLHDSDKVLHYSEENDTTFQLFSFFLTQCRSCFIMWWSHVIQQYAVTWDSHAQSLWYVMNMTNIGKHLCHSALTMIWHLLAWWDRRMPLSTSSFQFLVKWMHPWLVHHQNVHSSTSPGVW
jgi:hypothetical protein